MRAPQITEENKKKILSMAKDTYNFDSLRNRVRLRALMVSLKGANLFYKTLPKVSPSQVKEILEENKIDYTGSKKFPYKYKGVWYYPTTTTVGSDKR